MEMSEHSRLRKEMGIVSAEELAIKRGGTPKQSRNANSTQKNINHSLQEAIRLMTDEVVKVDGSREKLDEFGEKVDEALNKHRGLTSATKTGRNLINIMSRRETTTMLLAILGCVFFYSVVGYIFLDRIGII